MHDGKVRFDTRLTGLAAVGKPSALLHFCGFSSWIKCISTTQLAPKLEMNSELIIRRVVNKGLKMLQCYFLLIIPFSFIIFSIFIKNHKHLCSYSVLRV